MVTLRVTRYRVTTKTHLRRVSISTQHIVQRTLHTTHTLTYTYQADAISASRALFSYYIVFFPLLFFNKYFFIII